MRTIGILAAAFLAVGAFWLMQDAGVPRAARDLPEDQMPARTEKATFAAGCFWCVEAVFQEVDGVLSVRSGYAGGKTENPTYRQVCNGETDHAEACEIVYDPEKVTYETLLDVFFKTHDPTQLNRQGNDVGTQYRSAVFYHDEAQKLAAERKKKEIGDAIVTEIAPAGKFYEAEEYHQNYFIENPRRPYCVTVVKPKVEKFREAFPEKLKP